MKRVTFNVLSLFIVNGSSPVPPALERKEFFHMVLLTGCFPRVSLPQDIKKGSSALREAKRSGETLGYRKPWPPLSLKEKGDKQVSVMCETCSHSQAHHSEVHSL